MTTSNVHEFNGKISCKEMTITTAPSTWTDSSATTKSYVDNLVSGLNVKMAWWQ